MLSATAARYEYKYLIPPTRIEAARTLMRPFMAPDRFACHKGLNFTEIHHDPDRLNHPLARSGGKDQVAAFEQRRDRMVVDGRGRAPHARHKTRHYAFPCAQV